MRLVVVLILVSLSLATSFWPGAVQADGGFGLLIEPEELEWGQSVRLEGSAWPKGNVQISARFLSERFQPDGSDIPPIAPGDFSFQQVIAFDDIAALPLEPTPGWVEITVLVGEVKMHRSLVVVADGRRPPDAAYISGRVHNLPSPSSSVVIVWSAVGDSAAHAFTWVVTESGQYETDYISEGEWFVALYALDEQRYAGDRDLTAITAYSKKLDRYITLTGRVVTVRPGEAVEAVDFTLVEGPPPAAEATRIPRLPTPTPWPLPGEAKEPNSSSSNGWLATALFGAGGGLLVAVAGTIRLVARRRSGQR